MRPKRLYLSGRVRSDNRTKPDNNQSSVCLERIIREYGSSSTGNVH